MLLPRNTKKLSRINHPQSQGKRMMAHRYIVLASLLMAVLQACGSGNSEEIVTLQKQVAALTHQVEETRRQVESMQEADQKLNKSLESLETELDHLKVSETSPPAPAAKPGGEKGTPAAPPPQSTAKVSCPQVWKMLGQGKSEAAVAQALGSSVEAVRDCEQQVGRGGTRR